MYWHDLLNFALGLAGLGISGLFIRVYHYFDALEEDKEEHARLLYTVRADCISIRRESGLDPYPYDRED